MGTPNPASVPKKRRSILRRLIIIGIIGLGLLILIVGAAIAYVYYFGATPTPAAVQTTAPKPQTSIATKPVDIPEDAKVGVSVQTITSPVMPGQNSYVAIKTLVGSTCTIDVKYNNVKSTDSGLVAKTADEYGTTSWSWTVGKDTPLGSWPVTITCTRYKESGVVAATLVVSRDVQ